MFNKYSLYTNQRLLNLINSLNFNIHELNNFPKRVFKEPLILNAILSKLNSDFNKEKCLNNKNLIDSLLEIDINIIEYVQNDVITKNHLNTAVDKGYSLNYLDLENISALDEEIIMKSIKNGMNYENIPNKFKNNKNIIKEAIKVDKNVIKLVDPNIIDKEIVDLAFRDGYISINSNDKHLFKNIEFAKKALEMDGDYLQYIENLTEEMINIATKNKGLFTNKALSEELFSKYLDNPLVVRITLNNIPKYIKVLNEEYQLKYYDYIKEALNKDGICLNYVIDEYKDNFDMVNTAIKSNPRAFYYASTNMKNIRKNVYAALENDSYQYKYISKRLKDSTEILMLATKNDGYALNDANDRLKKDKTIIETIIKRNPKVIKTMPTDIQFDILNCIFNNIEPYNKYSMVIDIKEVLNSYCNSLNRNEEFIKNNIDKIISYLNIEKNDFTTFAINKLGIEVIFTKNSLLFNNEVIQKIGKENVYMILKYLSIPDEELNINNIISSGKLDELIKYLKVLGNIDADNFDLKIFQSITNGFDKNINLINNIKIDSINKKELFLLKKLLFDNKIGAEFNTISDLKNYPKIKYDENNDLINSDSIENYKNVIFDVLCSSSSNDITQLLSQFINGNKLNDLQNKLGNEYYEQIEYYKYFSDILSKINNCDDKVVLKDIAIKLNKKAYDDNQNLEESWIDEINRNFTDFSSSLKSLYGLELKQSLLNLNQENNKIIKEKYKNTDIDVYTLNGCDFKILIHVLNAYCSAGNQMGKLSDFDERENGQSYICTSLISNNYLGHANRGENSVNYVKLGFLEIDPDMLSISAPTDVYSKGEKNSRELTSSSPPNFMITDKTCLKTLHTHNEYVIYRESNSHKKIYPNCIICFEDEINESHLKAANSFNPPLPIVKINTKLYQKSHLENIQKLEDNILNGGDNVEEYIYMMTSYDSGYKCFHNLNNEQYSQEIIKSKVNNLISYLSGDISKNNDKLINLLSCLEEIKMSNRNYYNTFDNEINSIRNMLITGEKTLIYNNEYGVSKKELEELKQTLLSSSIKREKEDNIIIDIINNNELFSSLKEKYNGTESYEWFCKYMNSHCDKNSKEINIDSDYISLLTFLIASKYNLSFDDIKKTVTVAKHYNSIKSHENDDMLGLKNAQHYLDSYRYSNPYKFTDEIVTLIKSCYTKNDDEISQIANLNYIYDIDKTEKIEKIIKLSHILKDAIKIYNGKINECYDTNNSNLIDIINELKKCEEMENCYEEERTNQTK